MRVLIAHNDYGAPSGEEHAILSIASLLESKGHSVSWCRRSSAEIRGLSGQAKAFVSGIYSYVSRRRITGLVVRDRPDLVQVQNLYPFLSPSILGACRKRRVPVVMRCPNYRLFCPNSLHLSHGEICERCLGGKEYWCVLRNCERDYFKSLGYALRTAVARISRSILDNVHVFIVLSEFQKRRFIEGGIPAERIEILPNVVPEVGGQTSEVGDLITFVGRSSPEKGIEDFVAAARALPELPFAVAGSTDRMPWLVQQGPKNIRWLGFLHEKELNEAYARSRLLVFPFRWFEGFPNVVTRAMAIQKPVLASRIGALPEIIDDGRTGLLFEMGNVENIVARIRELYSDNDRCRAMGEKGRQKALAQYSPDVVYRRLMEIYQKAITLNGGPPLTSLARHSASGASAADF